MATTHYRDWLPDLPYAATAVNHEHHVEFSVYAAGMVSLDGSPERVGYERQDAMSQFTHDPTQARVVLAGSVKWDGCSNWDYRTREAMAHYCGEEDAAAVGTLMRRLYAWARELGQDRLDVRPEHDLPGRVTIRPETDSLVDYLNGLTKVDPDAMQALVDRRVPCNDHLAGHPSVQVHIPPQQDAPTFLVGLLGLLNGWCGVFPPGHPFAGYGPISAIYDGAGKLVGFNRTDRPERMLPALLATPGAVARQR